MSIPEQGESIGPPVSGISKGAQIAIGASLAALLLGWYGYTNLGGDATYRYYQTLEEFYDSGRAASGESLRVHGYVADDSIRRDLAGKRVHFRVQNDPPHASATGSSGTGATLSVVYRSLETPDLFKDGAEVVVEGRLESQGEQVVFVADNVLAKCPSKFQARAQGEPL
jgi:cytochrome c-type biogenesis protein CcmE